MPQLYERIEKGKQVRYVPYTPPVLMAEIDNQQLVTLMSTLVITLLVKVSEQLPEHARIAREVKRVEEDVVRLAKLNAAPLSEEVIEVGVKMWHSAVETMQRELGGEHGEN